MDRLARLYPKVDEKETPLPRSWSVKDKFSFLVLSQNNQKVHYKGGGKNHKDAASVRATHPIPAACGVYYFEIKVLNKGRDGYIGVGFSASGVNLNRLPGWEKNSYGYHADDGCVFNSSGTGQQYGSTFTTGDVVGCGFNLVDRSIFFTKNGVTIGTAVSDIAPNLVLYPTVGLQSQGELVEANFGESPFMFDFEGLLRDMQQKIRLSIEQVTLPGGPGEWQTSLHKLILGYLVHHGYSRTAQVFASNTSQQLEEDAQSIQNRQKIRSLILQGKISHALHLIRAHYPTLFTSNVELLFRVKCQQFVEMIAGCDPGDLSATGGEPRLSCHSELSTSSNGEEAGMVAGSPPESPLGSPTQDGTFTITAAYNNEATEEDSSMEVDHNHSTRPPPPLITEHTSLERILFFGRELQTMYSNLQPSRAKDQLKSLLHDAFSLLAYSDSCNSPVGYLLDPSQREPICMAVNSAILESKSLPGQPPLEFALGQSVQCLKLMSKSGLGAAAFTGVQDIARASP